MFTGFESEFKGMLRGLEDFRAQSFEVSNMLCVVQIALGVYFLAGLSYKAKPKVNPQIERLPDMYLG